MTTPEEDGGGRILKRRKYSLIRSLGESMEELERKTTFWERKETKEPDESMVLEEEAVDDNVMIGGAPLTPTLSKESQGSRPGPEEKNERRSVLQPSPSGEKAVVLQLKI